MRMLVISAELPYEKKIPRREYECQKKMSIRKVFFRENGSNVGDYSVQGIEKRNFPKYAQ